MAHYLSALEVLAKRLTVLVHPIVPVLDETRPMVVQYNALLEASVRRSKRLTWLSGVFEGLLDPSGRLREDFKLDGTHLHPAYVSRLLTPALKMALDSK